MRTFDYRFVTRWRVFGTAAEVFAVLSDPGDLPRWWPSVYLAVAEIEPGRENGAGRRIALLTRGWLPYTLGWRLRVASARPPHELAIEAEGDLEGRGLWTLTSEGAWVDVRFDWEVEAKKPLLRALSPLFSPILAANHRWAMARGEESLVLELSRRRAAATATAGTLSPVAPAVAPPGPARYSALVLAAGAAAVLGVCVGVSAGVRRIRRRRRFLSWR